MLIDIVQLVSICDNGSLHGTTLNGFVLPAGAKKRIQVGDMLKFGVPVEKESKAFHPSQVQISCIDLGPPQFVDFYFNSFAFTDLSRSLPPRASRTYTFTVPDDSEVEDASDEAQDGHSYSGSDDGGVARSALLVKQSNMPAVMTPQKSVQHPTIDLTDDIPEPVIFPRSSQSLPEPMSSTAKVDATPTTTFAPALRYQESTPDSASQQSSLLRSGVSPLGLEDPLTALEDQPSGVHATTRFSTEGSPAQNFPSSSFADVPGPQSSSRLMNATFSHVLQDESRVPRPLVQARRQVLERLLAQKSDNIPPPPVLDFSDLGSEVRSNMPPLQHPAPAPRLRLRKRKFVENDSPEGEVYASDFVFPPFVAPAQTVKKAEQVQATINAPTPKPVVNTTVPVSEQSGSDARLDESHPATPQQPPRKKMRRVAEAVGYAALGGIAVMSALIATAPEF